jgi:hypothetical protein
MPESTTAPETVNHTALDLPAASAAEDDRCGICAEERVDCGNCDGSGEDMDFGTDEGCEHCGGRGEKIPEHCCNCGGGEYDCHCCSTCGGYAGTCSCPIPVERADGTTAYLVDGVLQPHPPRPDDEEIDDDPMPPMEEPPDGYYDQDDDGIDDNFAEGGLPA